MTSTAIEVAVPPLLSLVLTRHRFDEIHPSTVANLLIAVLWDRLASVRYRGPSLVAVLRRRRRRRGRGRRRAAHAVGLSALDRECHTLLTLCRPPRGWPHEAVGLGDLDLTSAVDHYGDALQRELRAFCHACARLQQPP